MNKNLNIRIDAGLLKRYRKFCKDNQFSISERIRYFIEKELEKELNPEKLASEILKRTEYSGQTVTNSKMDDFVKTMIEEIVEAIQKDMRISVK